MKLKTYISNHYTNFRSYSSKKKLVSIESDDWGATRMPCKKAFSHLVKEGVVKSNNPYAMFDSIALDDDWDGLYHVLNRHIDKNGHHPIFTLNVIVANPDFEKIYNSGYQKYSYEHFIKTCIRQNGSENYENYLNDGIKNGFICPQLHGREHVHVNRWLRELKNGNKKFLKAFELKSYFVELDSLILNNKSIFAAFDYDDPNELIQHKEILKEATNIFEEYFGSTSKSIIFPNYIWSKEQAHFAKELGVEFIQGTKFQNIPKAGIGYKRKFRFSGQNNGCDQINLVRNCFFEPSSSRNHNTVQNCLKEIDISFRHQTPAIISSHRLNYIGRLNEKNRNYNLKLLNELLSEILKKWPDVEFVSSQDLGKLISNK